MLAEWGDDERKLTDRVSVLVGAKNGRYPSGNTLLVRGAGEAVVIDPSVDVISRGGVPVAIDAVIAKTEELQAADLLPTPVANENVFARAEKAAKAAEVSEPKKAPSAPDQSVAARVTSLMTGHEEGELDSVYEGRASTPKSKAKKKTKAKSRKRAKKTKPKA